MSQHSQAAVFHGPGKPLTLDSFPLPNLQTGEVLVRVTCATLCGSDIHSYQGRRPTPTPTILGHEILGTIAELADEAPVCQLSGQPLSVGDRVTWSIAASCGNCFYCARELPQKCEHLFKYGHQQLSVGHPLSGGLAEYCHLAAGTAVCRLPDDLPDTIACPVNCATATVAAALRQASDCDGLAVLIQGAGMLGLTAAAMAKTAGAAQVLVCDISESRLARANDFGATETMVVSDDGQALIEAVHQATNGHGVDLALEISGAASAVQLGTKLLRIGGRYVLVGSTFPTDPIALDPQTVVRRLLHVIGNHNYIPIDLVSAVQFLTEFGSTYPFADLVDDGFTLREADAAFAQAIQGNHLRVAVRPTQK